MCGVVKKKKGTNVFQQMCARNPPHHGAAMACGWWSPKVDLKSLRLAINELLCNYGETICWSPTALNHSLKLETQPHAWATAWANRQWSSTCVEPQLDHKQPWATGWTAHSPSTSLEPKSKPIYLPPNPNGVCIQQDALAEELLILKPWKLHGEKHTMDLWHQVCNTRSQFFTSSKL